ncbi:MAG: branched-chain amino acid ABC transporter permease [Sporichthyaceae bacterium]
MALLDRADAPRLNVPRRDGFGPIHPGPVAIVAALLCAPLALDGYWTFVVGTGLVLAISCLGLHVLWGWARQISLMQAGLAGASTYICFRVLNETRGREVGVDPEHVEWWWRPVPNWGSPWLVGALVAVVFCVAVSLAVGLLARRLVGAYLVALTFAVQFAIEQSVFTRHSFTGGLVDYGLPRPEPFGISLDSETRFYYAVSLILLGMLFALHRLRGSRYGRAIIFVGRQPEAAAAAGISPSRYRAVAWAIAGLCAAVSGWVQSPLYRNPPGSLQYVSFNSVVYLAVVVLAGSVSLLAVVVVALALQLTPQVLIEWQVNVYLVGGIGMAVGVLVGPRGVGGVVVDLFGPPRWRR